MQTEENIVEVQRVPLGSSRFRKQVENFLATNGLRLEVVDDYFCVLEEDGSMVAGAGLAGDVIKCVAVEASARSRGLVAPLVSRIIAYASEKGICNLKVFTKPENEAVFTSLGFHTIASAPLAILMENGRGLEDYLKSLSCAGAAVELGPYSAPDGVIVMNANPFTLGHKYLIEKAKEQVEKLFVIPVKEDVSLFPYEERLEMIRCGCGGLATILEGSDYQISATTFPTYFLKDLTEASETQMRLDLDLFARHIAPALGVTVRFVGTEPSDPLTARYNELMKEVLPSYGISVIEIPRLKEIPGQAGDDRRLVGDDKRLAGDDENVMAGLDRPSPAPITATEVRNALEQGSFQAAAALAPPTTWPYLVAELMARALRLELETPMKPGLVDKCSTGAHSDMDYALMKGSIDVIRRSFIRHFPIIIDFIRGQKEYRLSDASLRSAPPLASHSEAPVPPLNMPRVAVSSMAVLLLAAGDSITEFGKAIEAEVLDYTRGVNTYRGAIFALGLAAIATLIIARDSQLNEYQDNRQICLVNNDHAPIANILTDSPLRFTVTELSERIAELSGLLAAGNDSHGAKAVKEHGVKGALQLAQEGYKPLFEDWLPFYRSAGAAGLRQCTDVRSAGAAGLRPCTDVRSAGAAGLRQCTDVRSAGAAGLRPYSAAAKRGWTRPGPDGTADIASDGTAGSAIDDTAAGAELLQKTLLRIMSSLDDTCVIHRVGYNRAQEVKEEAKALLDNFSEEGLKEMKKRYDAEGISPGGAADMLALTIFVDSLIN